MKHTLFVALIGFAFLPQVSLAKETGLVSVSYFTGGDYENGLGASFYKIKDEGFSLYGNVFACPRDGVGPT